MISLKNNIQIHINNGKKIVEDNNFYSTLNILLKYYFVNKNEKDLYLHNVIKDVTKNENEFKVFMVFKEYALELYYSKLKKIVFFNDISIDDKVYIIISYLKNSYDEDRSVIKPFINSINENTNEIIEKYNFIKNNYIIKIDLIDKFKKLNESVNLLEKAEEYQKNADIYRKKAMEILYDIKNPFEDTLNKIEVITKSNILSIT